MFFTDDSLVYKPRHVSELQDIVQSTQGYVSHLKLWMANYKISRLGLCSTPECHATKVKMGRDMGNAMQLFTMLQREEMSIAIQLFTMLQTEEMSNAAFHYSARRNDVTRNTAFHHSAKRGTRDTAFHHSASWSDVTRAQYSFSPLCKEKHSQ